MTEKTRRSTVATGRATLSKTTKKPHLHYSKSAPGHTTPIRRADGRIVGELAGNALRKRARREYQLREPAGWAWDDCILDAAERAEARWTEIKCDGRIYRAALSDFRCYGFPIRRGHGEQTGLALSHWHVRRVGEAVPALQLDLFGGAQ